MYLLVTSLGFNTFRELIFILFPKCNQFLYFVYVYFTDIYWKRERFILFFVTQRSSGSIFNTIVVRKNSPESHHAFLWKVFLDFDYLRMQNNVNFFFLSLFR